MNGRFAEIAFDKFDAQTHTKDEEPLEMSQPKVFIKTKYNTKAHIFSSGVIFQKLFSIDHNSY